MFFFGDIKNLCTFTAILQLHNPIIHQGKTITLKVGVSSSAGYVRKIKQTSGSSNGYYTFYSILFQDKCSFRTVNIIKIDINTFI